MRLYVASAGTGKTHTLVEELLALLERGVPLRRIAAVTFTRKAAEELRARAKEGVERLLAKAPGAPWAEEAGREVHGAVFTTIHGFLAEALRHAAPMLSLDPDFALLDELVAEALFLEEARSLLYLLGLAPDPWLEVLHASTGSAPWPRGSPPSRGRRRRWGFSRRSWRGTAAAPGKPWVRGTWKPGPSASWTTPGPWGGWWSVSPTSSWTSTRT